MSLCASLTPTAPLTLEGGPRHALRYGPERPSRRDPRRIIAGVESASARSRCVALRASGLHPCALSRVAHADRGAHILRGPAGRGSLRRAASLVRVRMCARGDPKSQVSALRPRSFRFALGSTLDSPSHRLAIRNSSLHMSRWPPTTLGLGS